MKKHVLGMIAALFVFTVLLPVGVRAANTAYAILYDDGTLVFQNSETPEPGRKANRRYTFDLTAVYTQASKVPWYEERQILRTVDFAEKISPISTAYWFYNCIQLQRIDNIQNLDTANTTNMSHMFYSCTHIEELDLSNFDTAKVTDMEQMFWGCLRLKVIYASSKFTTASLKSKLRSQNSNDTMFNGCKVLVGGNGTQFKTTYKDTNYARIDTLDTPGYFTAKEPDPTPVPPTYTVIWQNYDGAILKADTNVSAGTFPAYSGATPTRIGHTFTGWSPQPSAVTGNVTYTATFEAVSSTYTVIWQNYDGTILKADTDVSAGTFPTYSGATPTRTGYTFTGWSPQPSAVTGNITYTAQFAKIAAPSFDVRRDAYPFGNGMSDFGYASRGGPGGGKYPISSESVFLIFGNGVKGKMQYKKAVSAPWYGNCAGMSASAALLFAYGQLNPSDFGKSDAWSLAIGDKNAEISVLTFVEAMQIAQYTDAFGRARQANQVPSGGSLNRLWQDVKSGMEKGRPTLIAIVKEKVGGHALLAVGADEAGNRILIYDCNHPGELQYMTLSDNMTGWSYDMGGHGVWGSVDSACSISYVPYDVLEEIWTKRGKLNQNSQVLTVNAENLSITNFDGDTVASLEDGKLVKSAEGVYELVDLSMYWPEERSICLPRNEVYTLSTSDDITLNASMTDRHMSAEISTSANTVTFGVNDDEKENGVIVEGASASDTYSISLESDFEDLRFKTMTMTGSGQGQDVSVSLNQDDGLTFVNCNIGSLSVDGKSRVYGIASATPDASGHLSVTLTNPGAATLAAACFDRDGKFVSASLRDVPADVGTASVTVPADAKSVRVALFDNAWRPLCAAFEAAL